MPDQTCAKLKDINRKGMSRFHSFFPKRVYISPEIILSDVSQGMHF